VEQYEVRKMVKIAKAKNDDIYYKDFAEYLNITQHGFYNWLKGYYRLSDDKLERLRDVVVDLAMD
jgi:hypothetical protein